MPHPKQTAQVRRLRRFPGGWVVAGGVGVCGKKQPVTPYVSDPDFQLYVGDVRDVLKTLEAESVDCCVTSPPYLGLRDYGHDSQIGLEGTLGEYVATMVDVFREVRRVLTPTATCWLNLGDSYSSDPNKGGSGTPNGRNGRGEDYARGKRIDRGEGRWGGGNVSESSLKPKDLMGVPWRVALALQDDGWYLRSDIIWSKPNPMPESVTDRPTKSHEYVFLLSKSPRYFYDAAAIAEPATWYGPNGKPKSGPHAGQMHGRAGKEKNPTWQERKAAGATRGNVAFGENVGAGTQRGVHGEGVSHDLGNGLTRNARSVWEIQTQQYADAHFAVFPEALPERCIKAGCPEWVCATCGKPRERIVELVDRVDTRPGNPMKNDDSRNDAETRNRRMVSTYGTAGWSDCGHNNYRPGTVLDPFMGSGTTALVARRLGRRSVGVELNPTYAELAARRLQQLSLLAEPAA